MKRFLSLKTNERAGERSTQVLISPSQALVKNSSLFFMAVMILLTSAVKNLNLAISLETV